MNKGHHQKRAGWGRKLFLFLLSCTLFVVHAVRAQLTLVPLPKDPAELRQRALRVQAMELPFFDDFATTTTARPNTTYWEAGSGVYINNTLATNQPSLNFATFDGLNSSGVAYEGTNSLLDNFTDTLTSQPINLSGLTARDSVYLSFYWLCKGLGERPDISDAFQLEFKNSSNGWTQIWKHDGELAQDSLFTQQFIAITDPAYFHGNFQFRFRSRGKMTGPFDTWHLDYVYLDKGRSLKVKYLADVAMRRPLTPVLKRYSALPFRTFVRNPSAYMAATLVADVKNNFDNPSGFNALSGTYVLSDARVPAKTYQTSKAAENVASLKATQFKIPLTTVVPTSQKDSLRLLSKFYMTTTDNKTPGVNLFINDTISAYTDLSTYYAYDDGSAEYGVQMNQRLGRVAVRFVTAGTDTIGGVRMSIVPFNKDVSGQSFTIQLWSNFNGKPDQLLAQRSVAARYPAQRNGFVEYSFADAVAVKDTFYVGWLQINEQPIAMGFDRNSTLSKDQVFFDLGSEWVRDATLAGNIMIRPVIGSRNRNPITGVEPTGLSAYFYPNPLEGTLNWSGTSLTQIDVYAVDGRLVHQLFPSASSRSSLLTKLHPGIYLLKGFDGKRTFIQKMVVVK